MKCRCRVLCKDVLASVLVKPLRLLPKGAPLLIAQGYRGRDELGVDSGNPHSDDEVSTNVLCEDVIVKHCILAGAEHEDWRDPCKTCSFCSKVREI